MFGNLVDIRPILGDLVDTRPILGDLADIRPVFCDLVNHLNMTLRPCKISKIIVTSQDFGETSKTLQ